MDDQPDGPSGRGPALAVAALLLLGGGGAWLALRKKTPEEKPALFTSRAQDAAHRDPFAGARGHKSGPAIQGVVLGELASSGQPEAAPAKEESAQTEADFNESALKAEEQVRALGRKYSDRYPVIRQYGEDWISYPDLKKLRDDFWRDKNPAQFMRGLAASENFPKLAKKYIASPEIHAFIRDAITQAPGDLMSAAAGFLGQEKSVNQVVNGVAKEMGISTEMLDSGKKPAAQSTPGSTP